MASLTILGTGIKFLSHLTIEAKAHIQQAGKVLYLVNDPLFKTWIAENNLNSESLDDLYFKHDSRVDAYKAISEYILLQLEGDRNTHVCVVLYGHPTMYAEPALTAARVAKAKGYKTEILPGISAENCLFADLMLDPGEHGCQSYEATDFLIYGRPLHLSTHLILWQVGMIGAIGFPAQHNNARGLKCLKDYLLTAYHPQHAITLYEAAQYPGFAPKIVHSQIQKIPELDCSSISTLYVPPQEKPVRNSKILSALGF